MLISTRRVVCCMSGVDTHSIGKASHTAVVTHNSMHSRQTVLQMKRAPDSVPSTNKCKHADNDLTQQWKSLYRGVQHQSSREHSKNLMFGKQYHQQLASLMRCSHLHLPPALAEIVTEVADPYASLKVTDVVSCVEGGAAAATAAADVALCVCQL